ncbi:MAG: sigma-70 family RNA polymerase sigma factor [Pegethrix bostrychoides GSE-TBD4-15B]|uniref:Sigma-70 family RNA polymerase sigma factor n=1 Tax=Pegethrix bostrychoides GSE-TBD4-15B TaxID=2839662 RepID=A0A951PCH0_9CYAN|nr:sigma-70 family RNA polymerase sigma factor [Pegethrix bostrychoides GSE-TBD4-15B]
MQIPAFPECNHSLVQSLHHHSDCELLTLFQRHPEDGKYFLAIFCRYSPIVYSLIQHSVRSPAQTNYLFAITWRHLFYELGGLDLSQQLAQNFSLQNWLIQVTALCINRVELPAVEEINYSLQSAAPPLWCFMEQALEYLLPRQRLMVLMAQTFHWSESRIAAYLQAEGEMISAHQVRQELELGYQQLELALPEDICAIYLQRPLPDALSQERAELEDIFRLNPLEPVFEA